MAYDSINLFIYPCIRICTSFMSVGIILRCIVIILERDEEDTFGSVIKKIRKKIIVAILALCALEVIKVIAKIYT